METMRFAMVTTHYPPNHIGGDAVLTKYLSEELVAQGHEVHVIFSPAVFRTLRSGSATNRRPGCTRSGLTTHAIETGTPRVDIARAYAFGWSRGNEKSVLDTVARTGADVVHWHNTRGFVARPPNIGGVVQLHTAHDYYDVCPRADLLRAGGRPCQVPHLCMLCTVRRRRIPQLWRIGRSRVIGFPKDMRIMCPSEFMRERLEEDGVRNIHLMRNFVPRPVPRSAQEGDERRTLLYLGILESHKGPHTLIDAFAKSAGMHDFELVIVGDGTMRGALESRVRALGMTDRVRFAGYLPDAELDDFFRRTAYMIIPSEWFENAPLTVLESFSRGVPVIGSDIGGLPEILHARSGSFTFKPGDSSDLASEIIHAWSHRDKLDSNSNAARRYYEENFSPEKHIREYLRLVKY